LTDSKPVELFENSGILTDFEPFFERFDGILFIVSDEIDAAKI
jgi:hypothetical protein